MGISTKFKTAVPFSLNDLFQTLALLCLLLLTTDIRGSAQYFRFHREYFLSSFANSTAFPFNHVFN
jgi:hypothetical protein